ncbi:MAG TPA: hypothetical protein VE935_06055 [Burkholderiales bacterium]|nr:hypothetical protein [Burkholderiales bacterium]
MQQAIAEWASLHPRIRRVWACEHRFAVELEPVADSEETLTQWLTRGALWRGELQAAVDPGIELGWFDPDGAGVAVTELESLVYERGM